MTNYTTSQDGMLPVPADLYPTGVTVEVTASGAESRGQHGTVTKVDRDNGSYTVQFQDGSTQVLLSEDVRAV